MEKDQQDIFNMFLAKAEKRLEEKTVQKNCLVKVPSMGETIRIRGLSRFEIAEIMEIEDESDPFAGDKYSVYLSVTEPDLREIAKKLKEEGRIQEYVEVTDIFEIYEIKQLAAKIMELSGVTGKSKVEVVTESLKN